MSPLFPSIGLSICALAFLLLVAMMYFSKKKFKNIENNIYAFLLALTAFLVLLEIICVYLMSKREVMPIINEIACRTYILGGITWVVCFLIYLWSLSNKDKAKQNKKRTLITITNISFFVIVILFLISCMLPVTYTGGSGDLFVIGGPAVIVLYFIAFILIIGLLFTLLKNNMNLPLSQRAPVYFTVIFFTGMSAVQMLFNYDFNDLSYVFAFCVITLYFTIESQDNKLLNELEISKEEAQKADNIKTEFLSNMSHEIRTPMNTILGFSEALLKEKKLTEEIVKKDARNIYDESINLLDLINNILDISRLESNKEEIEEKEYELKNIIYELNSTISSKIDKEKLDFEIVVNENIPCKYYGDSKKIYKIIKYVLTNAIKYTNYGKLKIYFNANPIDNVFSNLDITISNTGHAMKAEEFEKDFNDFVKLENGNQNNIDSVTLGLIIAKRLVSMLSGDIKFINEEGKGTRYIISLKQKVTSFEKIGILFDKNEQQIPNSELLDCSSKNILIVDDNRINIKLASRILEGYKFNIDIALSGNECIEKVKQKKYDMIFLDHMMPELDGIATLKILKSSGYYLPPVVALTANSFDGLKERYEKEGFDDYLSKPINFKELNKLINKYFNK